MTYGAFSLTFPFLVLPQHHRHDEHRQRPLSEPNNRREVAPPRDTIGGRHGPGSR